MKEEWSFNIMVQQRINNVVNLCVVVSGGWFFQILV